MLVVLRVPPDELPEAAVLELVADVERRPVGLDVIVLHPEDLPRFRVLHRPPVSILALCLHGENMGTLRTQKQGGLTRFRLKIKLIQGLESKIRCILCHKSNWSQSKLTLSLCVVLCLMR